MLMPSLSSRTGNKIKLNHPLPALSLHHRASQGEGSFLWNLVLRELQEIGC